MSQQEPDAAAEIAVQLPDNHYLRDTLVSGGLIAAVVLFLVFNRNDFAGTLQIIRHASPELLLLGMGLVAGSYFMAALSYVALGSARNLRLFPTFVVQVASGITNRLLPAGLGAAGLYAVYLKKQGFRYSQATAIVAANNIFGAIGNFMLLVIALALAPKPEQLLHLNSLPLSFAIGIVCIAIVIIILGVIRRRWLDRMKQFVRDTLRSLRFALRPSQEAAVSVSCNLAITTLNCLILCLAVAAVGESMFWPLSVAVLSIGALLGAAVPTPGGLGGVEAGILGGLIACGVPAAPALAATLLYRVMTYWLPIVPGIAALPWVQRHYLR